LAGLFAAVFIVIIILLGLLGVCHPLLATLGVAGVLCGGTPT
jgi:hypothetical protein